MMKIWSLMMTVALAISSTSAGAQTKQRVESDSLRAVFRPFEGKPESIGSKTALIRSCPQTVQVGTAQVPSGIRGISPGAIQTKTAIIDSKILIECR